MSTARSRPNARKILTLLAALATSLLSLVSAIDNGHPETFTAGSRSTENAKPQHGPTVESNPRSTALTRTADALAKLRHLAEDAPFEGYDAERGRNVGELLRYLDGRGRSKLSALINAAEDYHRRSKEFKYADDDEMRVHYEERLIEEFLGRNATSDAQGRTAAHRSVKTSGDDHQLAEMTTTDWLVCRADYGAFVEPITNSLWNAVRQAVCDAIPIPPGLCNQIETLPEKESPPWGRRMIDAMAKIPTAISEGKLSWVGAYDMCENYEVDDNATHQFNGRYCRLDIAVSSTNTLQLGVCVPNTCDNTHVLRYITEENKFLPVLLQVLSWNVTYAHCIPKNGESDSNAGSKVSKLIILITLVLVVLATLYDGFIRKSRFRLDTEWKKSTIKAMKEDEKLVSKEALDDLNRISRFHRVELWFIAFSAYSNCRRIFTMRTKSGHLAALDGVRSLSYGYTIWGQTYVLGPLYTDIFLTGNILAALQTLPQSFKFQPIMNFHLAADSFLLISGILVTYGFLKRSDNIRGLRAVLRSSFFFLLRRYWRLMPALMLAIMAITNGSGTPPGPFTPVITSSPANCKINWWVNLLMVTNLVNVDEQCLGHTWFISMVFQLYIASLIVVIPLLLRPKIGYVTLALLYIGHIVCTAILTDSYRTDYEFGTWYDGYLITPWCRAGPFIIGLAFGILFYAKPNGVKLKAPIIVLLWLVSFGSIVTVSCVSYDQFRENGNTWSPEGLAAFDTLSRSVWVLAVGWIIVASQWGYAGVVRDLLTWKLFLPMSRLVYVAMVWHAPIIYNYVYALRQPLYISTYIMMYAAYAHMFLVLIVGLVMALLWDYPLGIRWQKVVLCRTWFEWIRSGRHQVKLINELVNDLDFIVNRPPTSCEKPTSGGAAIGIESDSQKFDF